MLTEDASELLWQRILARIARDDKIFAIYHERHTLPRDD